MRGYGCRGDRAGFVHLECLTTFAVSKEASDVEIASDLRKLFDAWLTCGNCKQLFQGTLRVEMRRRLWRRYRLSQNLDIRYNSVKFLTLCLGENREVDATKNLYDELSKIDGNAAVLDTKLQRADMAIKTGQFLEALELLKAILPEAKDEANVNRDVCYKTMVLIVNASGNLGRYQEALDTAAELLAFCKGVYGSGSIH